MERSLAEQQQRIDWLTSRLIHPTERIRQRSAEIQTLRQRLRRSIQQQSGAAKLRLINIHQRLHASQPQPDKQAEILSHLNHRLHSQVRWHISQQTAKLNALTSSLNQLDPKAVLARGYVLAVGPDGRAIRDATSLSPGNTLKLNFAHGSAAVTVDQVVATTEAD
jgi:exodeoxyribonuclease VII large subunit